MAKLPRVAWTAWAAEFYPSPEWKALRRRVIARARGRCERCLTPVERFQVHHLTYERFGGDELLSDLQAWCSACHRNRHHVGGRGSSRRALADRKRQALRNVDLRAERLVASFSALPSGPPETDAERWKRQRAEQRHAI